MSRRTVDQDQIKKLLDEGLSLEVVLERTGVSRTSVAKVRRAIKTQVDESHAAHLKRYVALTLELERELRQAHRDLQELQRMAVSLEAGEALELKAEQISERIKRALDKLAGRGLG